MSFIQDLIVCLQLDTISIEDPERQGSDQETGEYWDHRAGPQGRTTGPDQGPDHRAGPGAGPGAGPQGPDHRAGPGAGPGAGPQGRTRGRTTGAGPGAGSGAGPQGAGPQGGHRGAGPQGGHRGRTTEGPQGPDHRGGVGDTKASLNGAGRQQ